VTNVDREFTRDVVDDQNVIEVPKKLLENLMEFFHKAKDEGGYVRTAEYLNALLSEDKVRAYLE